MALRIRSRLQNVSKRFASKKASKKQIEQMGISIASLVDTQTTQTMDAFIETNGAITNVTDAYKIQQATSQLLESQDNGKYKRLGYKIGATSAAIQSKFGITEPFVSPFYNTYRSVNNLAAEKEQGLTIGVESEFIFKIGKTLDLDSINHSNPLTLDDIYPLIASVHPGFELVEPRIINEQDNITSIMQLPVEYLIADLCWTGGCVIGSEVGLRELGYRSWKEYDEMECRDAAVELYVNSNQSAIGYGREVIGSPFNALLFVYNYLKQTGETLEEGMYVTTGTMTGCTFLNNGDVAEAVFENIGDVELKLL